MPQTFFLNLLTRPKPCPTELFTETTKINSEGSVHTLEHAFFYEHILSSSVVQSIADEFALANIGQAVL